MDKNYKIVEIPEVPSHHPGMEQVLTETQNQANNISPSFFLEGSLSCGSPSTRPAGNHSLGSSCSSCSPPRCLATGESSSSSSSSSSSLSPPRCLATVPRAPRGCRRDGDGGPAGQQVASNSDIKESFTFRIGDGGKQKVIGVLRLLLLRDQGGEVWKQIGLCQS